MQSFSYVRPTTVEEAIALLTEHGEGARLLAGGTDLVIELRNRWRKPKIVVDLKRIEELRPSIRQEDARLVITAGTVMADLAADERVRKHFPALVEAADVVGSIQIRNRATLAGNICNGSPAADTAPPLLVYGAEIVVAGKKGRRRVPVDEFIVGPGKVDLGPAELVTAIELPMPTPYDDFTPRAAQAFNDLPADVLANRALLRDVMVKHGFDPLPSEWWHFDFRGWERFDLLNVPFEEI